MKPKDPTDRTDPTDPAVAARVRPRLARAVAELQQLLASEKEDGRLTVETNRATVAELSRRAAAPAAPAAPAPRTAPVPAPAAPRPGPAPTEREVAEAREALSAVAAEVAACRNCPLHTSRGRTVPGQGNPRPEILFIGEAPGGEEDRQGLAFVGPAGQLLTRIITRMGFTREQVFIANICKCRPTEGLEMRKDRKPAPEEMAACVPYLQRQIAILKPKVIVALGATSVEALTGRTGITKLRGHWLEYLGVPLMPTYHPSYLLRGGGDEKARYWEVWEDMLQVLALLGRTAPPRS